MANPAKRRLTKPTERTADKVSSRAKLMTDKMTMVRESTAIDANAIYEYKRDRSEFSLRIMKTKEDTITQAITKSRIPIAILNPPPCWIPVTP